MIFLLWSAVLHIVGYLPAFQASMQEVSVIPHALHANRTPLPIMSKKCLQYGRIFPEVEEIVPY